LQGKNLGVDRGFALEQSGAEPLRLSRGAQAQKLGGATIIPLKAASGRSATRPAWLGLGNLKRPCCAGEGERKKTGGGAHGKDLSRKGEQGGESSGPSLAFLGKKGKARGGALDALARLVNDARSDEGGDG
jgi:hypothetical protein